MIYLPGILLFIRLYHLFSLLWHIIIAIGPWRFVSYKRQTLAWPGLRMRLCVCVSVRLFVCLSPCLCAYSVWLYNWQYSISSSDNQHSQLAPIITRPSPLHAPYSVINCFHVTCMRCGRGRGVKTSPENNDRKKTQFISAGEAGTTFSCVWPHVCLCVCRNKNCKKAAIDQKLTWIALVGFTMTREYML